MLCDVEESLQGWEGTCERSGFQDVFTYSQENLIVPYLSLCLYGGFSEDTTAAIRSIIEETLKARYA